MRSMALMPKDINFQDHLQALVTCQHELVALSICCRLLVLITTVAIYRMKLLGDCAIDLVACTIFNTKLLVDCMVT